MVGKFKIFQMFKLVINSLNVHYEKSLKLLIKIFFQQKAQHQS